MKTLKVLFLLIVISTFGSAIVNANNVRITSAITLTDQNTTDKSININFDIAWDNSWRDAENWDAVWVFFKFSNNNTWKQGYLSTDNTNYSVGTNNGVTPAFSVGTTMVNSVARGVGAYIYRNATGSGPINWQSVKLKWNYAQNGLSDAQAANASINVYAIEMVYVPQGSFNVGSGGPETSHFYNLNYSSTLSSSASITSNYYTINSENMIPVRGSGVGGAAGDFLSSVVYYGYSFTIPASFPKGYAAFYCMKYEITQEQYISFLNSLQPAQQINRISAIAVNTFMSTVATSTSPQYRNGIRCQTAPTSSTPGVWACDLNNNGTYNEAADGQTLACNYLSWGDAIAYADWAGLRPMTELEFEKACRGSLMTANEYAWGTTNIKGIQTISNSGSESETSGTTGANANYGSYSGVNGPMRTGCLATNVSTREVAGASYYGIMDLSGNLGEQVVPIGYVNIASNFDGSNGDGELYSNGVSDITTWLLNNSYYGIKGGSWGDSNTYLQVSDRNNYAYGLTSATTRTQYVGFRCVRTAQ